MLTVSFGFVNSFLINLKEFPNFGRATIASVGYWRLQRRDKCWMRIVQEETGRKFLLEIHWKSLATCRQPTEIPKRRGHVA